jgi:hypothetical protein
MSRQEVYDEITQALGPLPDSFAQAPDGVLEQWWTALKWTATDSKLTAKEKALIGMGVAAAVHCEY